ncbi:c-type cytochrome [Marinomonas flavescens]|uniref:c-type cytochrome n=1 Tax=Marinomonas flavescens TaxID=2529379 RepID=UPI001F0AEB8F|nr:c-type cytochrome [Marinomonas flavescens]
MTLFPSLSLHRLLLIGSALFLANMAHANEQSTNAIEARIAPVGKVCIEGQSCQQDAVATPVANVAPAKEYTGRAGEKIYNTYCIACHSTGAAGAPRVGNIKEWQPHIAKGMDTLLKDAIKGVGAMPPRGICSNCTDEELKHTIQYMIDKSQ